MNRILILTCTVILVMYLGACSEGNEGTTPVTDGDPSAEILSASDCKVFQQVTLLSGPGSSGETAVHYSYDVEKGILSLTHVNAGFNCCPGQLSASLSMEDRTITIIEREEQAACRCNCLFDLEIQVHNLSTGSWRIVFVEPYLHANDAPLSFSVDLITDPTGEHHVPRNHYPWGF